MKHSNIFWNKAARKYANSAIGDPDAYEQSLKLTQGYFKPDQKVLELGCGTGSTALIHAPYVKEYTATDYSSEMIAIATQKTQAAGIKNLDFAVAEVSDIDPSDAQYDVVLALNLIHLIEDQDAALKHINRLVKPGGLFISKTVCNGGKGFSLKFAVMMRVLPIMQFFGKAPYVGITSVAELENKITNAGFEIIEVGNYPQAPISRFVVARKP